MLCDKKTRNTPGNFDGSEVFIKVFPTSAHSFTDLNDKTVMAGDAVHRAGQ